MGVYKKWSRREVRWLWLAKFKLRGKYYRTKAQYTKAEAIAALHLMQAEVRDGRRAAVTPPVLLSQLAADFLEHETVRRQDIKSHQYRLEHLLGFFVGRRATEVTRPDVHAYTTHRLKEGAAPAT